jgi:hypothetical protein
MMYPPAAFHLLSNQADGLSADWVLWAIDRHGVVWLHEGPGVLRKGMKPVELIGKSVWELYRSDEPVLEFIRHAFQAPTTRSIMVDNVRVLAAGAPDASGGVSGVVLVLESAEPGAEPGHLVSEVRQPVPEIGAEMGDLLVLDRDSPGRIGIFRFVDAARAPAELVDELWRVSRAGDAPPQPAPSPPPPPAAGAAARRRAHAPHLRLLS